VSAKAATDNKTVTKTTAKAKASAEPKTTAAKATARTVTKTPQKTQPKAAAAKAPTKAPAKAAAAKTAAKAAEAEVSMAAAEVNAPDASVTKAAAPKAQSKGAAPAPSGEIRGLHLRYRDEVAPALLKEFGYANTMEVPRLSKIVVNIGLGEVLTNAKALDAAVSDLTAITGQKPIVTRARRSIAQFHIRTGNTIGAKVTLRGQRMWDFLERLTRLALPRIRDFRGVPGKSFDGRGNYSLGLREQLAFPEIDFDKIDKLRGLEVSIVTTARSDEESKRLLQLLGMPFAS
jgi:large subunit ribosomal protein L5